MTFCYPKTLQISLIIQFIIVTFAVEYFNGSYEDILVEIHQQYCTTSCQDSNNDKNGGSGSSHTAPSQPSFAMPMSTIFQKSDCCQPCSCEEDCIRSDSCCPEMVNRIPKVSTRMGCQTPQLRPFGAKYRNAHAYYFLHGCSVSYQRLSHNDSIRHKCEHPRDYNETLETLIPVTHYGTYLTFANRYCALCNDVNEQSLVYWTPEISCVNETITSTSIKLLIREIEETETCNLIFTIPPVVEEYVQKCHLYITSCNVTGKWRQYDPDIESACNDYRSSFNHNYRNIFCYLCNKNEVSDNYTCSVTDPAETNKFVPKVRVSFSALLNFRQPYDEDETKTEQCKSNQVKDEFKGICRNITCYPGKELVNGKCQDIYEAVSGLALRYYFKLIPVYNLTSVEVSLLPTDVLYFLEDLGKSIQIPASLLDVHLYVRIKDDHYSAEPTLTTADYALLQIDLVVSESMYINSFSIQKILSYDGETIHVQSELGYSIPLEVLSVYAELNTSTGGLYDNIEGVKLRSLVSNVNEIYSRQVATSVDSDITIIVPPMMCPLIALEALEFPFQVFAWGIYIENVDVNFTRTEFVNKLTYPENEVVFLCKNTFLGVIEKLVNKELENGKSRTMVDSVKEWLTFVCTFLSVLCCILTLITYVVLSELRTQPGINNMMLTFHLMCAQLLFQYGAGQANEVSDVTCTTIGVFVHLSWLLTFMWMNVCSYHMFTVFRTVTTTVGTERTARTTLIYTLYCWIMAAIPIAIEIGINLKNKGDIGYGGSVCYISDPIMIGFTFALPLCIIILVNIVLFISVIVNVCRITHISSATPKNRNYMKIYTKLSVLTGFTWIFGLLFSFTNNIIFEFIFIGLNDSLGVAIFISFICNKRVWKLCRSDCRSSKSKYSDYTDKQTSRTNCVHVINQG